MARPFTHDSDFWSIMLGAAIGAAICLVLAVLL